jgi:hypothetical protein
VELTRSKHHIKLFIGNKREPPEEEKVFCFISDSAVNYLEI